MSEGTFPDVAVQIIICLLFMYAGEWLINEADEGNKTH